MVQLQEVLAECPELHTIILVDQGVPSSLPPRIRVLLWKELVTEVTNRDVHRRIDSDMAAILYTSGSTGKPKGVVLSHRNLMAGAASVASYLENGPDDRILCTLPLSFDYGLSQLTTAFHSGASAVLINYLLPQDVVNAVRDERITGLAGVPPLWGQLANLSWPETTSLRYITNSGGAMPRPVLESLRAKLPEARIYLMYGLTEAFRSTYLPPDQVMERPDSIGKAIPNADILVVRPDGTPCDVDEPGELVHRGPLVALGYWNDPEKTAERFRPLPQQPTGLPFPEIAVWSGDTVRRDAQGYLYFVGRRDDMIKVSGYRISPTEIEEVLLTIAGVREAIAFGVPHASWGQSVMAVISSVSETLDPATVIAACKKHLPAYMVPAQVVIVEHPLPRNPNGKLDRKLVQSQFANSSDESIQPRSQGAAPVRHHR
ncbi:acyl-CoA ligase (AMP-forming), exosortase A-associated [Noviherbaspirillum humi]|uniref:Acyl-CoA ligase (AMP-forming), exosortase A-associated n=2 Tax=Noviherbaspirillum humi TaxID=1688639 RepID=A0A239HIF8_9BURK|nr:acyl-CoA ligase (AMP-forming), exosortase A-associated [Noviherbaspirillum humi]